MIVKQIFYCSFENDELKFQLKEDINEFSVVF